IAKRYEYLEWARGERFIVEDDFDSEFFMPGKPIQTLFMLDDSNSVIYINTFSKSLSPSIRMGYMILPERLLDRYYETSGGFSCTVPVLEQYALAEFINKGYFEQHLSRVRRQRKLES
ncbi:MAG: PLP-dependent aminotransferase family protein, partial [Lachnospiraceae bacterium]|nr:PLP-dependent aminotransferase family protein [Lachnospiraceae bacterium]